MRLCKSQSNNLETESEDIYKSQQFVVSYLKISDRNGVNKNMESFKSSE